MAIQYSILQKGCKNIPGSGPPSGFQLLVKTAYYRGVHLSLIVGIEVTVDHESFERSKIQFT